ncbi:holo-ACP synthase [Thermotalea metallivorans]|uniref:Holo-[acyl-carrier-protein] synthase n=1 Tax=Thermotalea metallivorans TaxID=520762 RepID=A0A140L1N3_9FIRM|nr:holo-ACP synthase [Thermotalea metallivorans]KXG74458.1 Holo-[acyl-carrier-protein] synthase [Thermotalea metallivorans]
MIKGIGIDIIEIHRIILAINRNNKFLDRVFTAEEKKYFESAGSGAGTIAGNFAAKEAVLKALGSGLRQWKWTDVEVRRDCLGKPTVVLYNKAKIFAEEKKIREILVTISHSRDYAVAQAIAI